MSGDKPIGWTSGEDPSAYGLGVTYYAPEPIEDKILRYYEHQERKALPVPLECYGMDSPPPPQSPREAEDRSEMEDAARTFGDPARRGEYLRELIYRKMNASRTGR